MNFVTNQYRRWLRLLILIVILLSFGTQVAAEAPRMKTVLYGASYYHEYMPYEQLEKDVELMQKAGISVVRLGESTWASWEPREGGFEFAWMHRILDCLHAAGIQVILGTPTYPLPPWLYRTPQRSPARARFAGRNQRRRLNIESGYRVFLPPPRGGPVSLFMKTSLKAELRTRPPRPCHNVADRGRIDPLIESMPVNSQ